jgi:DNA-binding transcriptional LysR family regulator
VLWHIVCTVSSFSWPRLAFGREVGVTLEQLRIFVSVAHVEHFTRAAEHLKISQSAVSTAIASLESRYKVLLFDRSRRQVELTAAGNVFLAEAEAVLARVDLAERRLEDLADLRIGRLAVAASQTAANYWLPSLLNAFHERYPGVDIDLSDGNSTEVEKRVLRGQVDLGIVEQDPHDGTLLVEPLATDTLIAVVGRRHSWFGRDRVEWEELIDSPWVMREPGSGTRALFEAALIAHGVSPEDLDITLVLRTGEAVCNAVATGTSAAVISNMVAEVALAAGALQRILPISITRNFVALSLPGRIQPRTTIALLDHLRSSSGSGRPARGPRGAFRLIGKAD